MKKTKVRAFLQTTFKGEKIVKEKNLEIIEDNGTVSRLISQKK